MAGFEVLERDGLARLGRFETPHGPIETPALLPVIHPDPTRQPVPPRELRRRFGFGAVITSSYITWRTPPLRERAEEVGIHGLLDFDGPIMTDSGAFQQHAYGHVEVGPEEIVRFQKRIGSDIATVLDVFVEPDSSPEVAARGVETTIARARAARALHPGLLAVPVQGGLDPELRAHSAEAASSLGDVLAIGGVVPLLESYRFPDLARALLGAREAIAPECVVHLFGSGHPIGFAFGALFGVDLFDSSSYLKFARRGNLMFPDGTVSIDTLRESVCRCSLCSELPLPDVARRSAAERERRIAEHNLLMCAQELSEVRQAIRDGSLWELAERRAAAHPALQVGLRTAVRGVRAFLPTEPESRSSYRVVSATSGLRPAAIRFRAALARFRAGKGPYRDHPWVPLTPSLLRGTPTEDVDGVPLRWDAVTPMGPVPLELTELYPVGAYVGPEEFEDSPARRRSGVGPGDVDTSGITFARDRDWSDEWTRRQVDSLLEWRYGTDVSSRARAERALRGERSRRTGRLRAILREQDRAFTLGNDGVPRPTWRGAGWLHPILPFPASRIVVDPDAVEFVRDGRSLFSKFVRGGDAALVPGSSALLVDPDDLLLAVGRLLLAPNEMGRLTRGVAVRVTAHARSPTVIEADGDDAGSSGDASEGHP